MAAILATTLVAGCSSGLTPRQAARQPASEEISTPLPVVERTIHIVRRGTVTREVLFGGVVSASGAVAVVAPVAGVIAGPLPEPGTSVSAGDVLFELAPSLEVRLAAAELEAALLARDAGLGDTEEVTERVAVATATAAGLGLPVDERASLPLPELVAVVAPQDGTVVRVFPPAGEHASGQRIVEIGDVETLVVRADLNEEVAGLIRIGQVVALDGGGSGRPIPAIVNRVRVDPQGRPVLNAVFGPGDIEAGEYPPGTEVVLSQRDRPETAGLVLSVEVLASSLIVVEVVVEDETLSLDEAIRIAPGDGAAAVIVGEVAEIAVDEDGQPFLLIDVSGSDLALGERVSVSFAVSERNGVLWVVPEAIRSFAGRPFVIVVADDGAQSRVDVEVGLVTAERVEVVGALEEGEMVVEP